MASSAGPYPAEWDSGNLGDPDSPLSDVDWQVGPEMDIFATALDDCLSYQGAPTEKRKKIFKFVDNCHSHATEIAKELRRSIRKGGLQHLPAGSISMDDNEMDVDETEDDHPDSPGKLKDLGRWEKEAQTWDLLRSLLPLRYPEPEEITNMERKSRNAQSGGSLWSDFLEENRNVAEQVAVLEWLQRNAATGPDIDELVRELQQNADRGDIIAHGWLHTRSAIKLRKSMHGWPHVLDHSSPDIAQSHVSSNRSPLVTELDPDAVTRQERKIEPQDEYFERAIWVGCFQLLRRGSTLDQIREWCAERTEVWRAVSVSGLPLATQQGEPRPEYDAGSLALWRRMSFALARHGGSDDIERAVYGLLSGDIPSVEKVCKTWDDFMFMHYNALVRARFDSYVLSQCQPQVSASLVQNFSVFDAVQFHGDATTVETRLVASLEANAATSVEATDPMKQLQAALIANDLERHFYQQGAILTKEANRHQPSDMISDDACREMNIDSRKFIALGDHDGLRVAVHIFIVLSSLDELCAAHPTRATLSAQLDHRQLQENIVAVYVSMLRLADLDELIPLYCSRLVGSRCFQVLSNNLLHIVDRERRVMQLNLIRKAGLDVFKFVKTQPQYIFSKLDAIHGRDSPQQQFKIMGNGPPSIKYGRSIKMDFFGEDPDRIDHQDELLIRSVEWLLLVEELWPDVFAVAVKVYKYFLRNNHLNAARQFATRVPFHELARKNMTRHIPDTMDTSWLGDADFEVKHGTPSIFSAKQVVTDGRVFRDLECLIKALDTMETLASLAELSKEDPSAKRDFWSKVSNELKAVKDYIRPLLKDWLLAQEDDMELQHIRDAYLPETILAYVSILHFAGTNLSRDNLLECMDLAALIAEKDSDIAQCFVKANRMKELVEAFASCSKALAIMTGEKKTVGQSTKKLRENGWSRDLWSIKP